MPGKTAKRKLLFEDTDLPEKAQRFGLPDRWKFCPPMGKVVMDKFLPMKTPLNIAYDNLMERQYWFHPDDVFKTAAKTGGLKVGMWIDLSNTTRFYNKSEVERNDCIYKKMPMAGHRQSPTKEETAAFIQVVSEFFKSHPNDLIAIHCTHGFNRTGFLVVAYLVSMMDMGVDMAVVEFAKCRPKGIYKNDYLADLRERYGDEDDELETPGRPLWENAPVSEADFYYGMEDRLVAKNVLDTIQIPTTSNGHTNGTTIVNVTGKPQFMDGRVPSVVYVEDAEMRNYLQEQSKNYCKYKGRGFPGSQPVSLELNRNLDFLSIRPYMVSWKADGMRYLVFIEGQDQIYAFDRDNNVFQMNGITFINRKNERHLKNTLVDAEMIIEVVNGKDIPRLLIYDIIVFEGFNIGDTDFRNRYFAIDKDLILPRTKAMQSGAIRRDLEPISIRRKDFWELEHAHKIYEEKFMKSICHEVDGLIFQPVKLPYTAGRCDELLKWKPPSLCTIDFRLQIVKEQPPGELPVHVGYLYLLNYPREFAKMKATNRLKQYDGKIIECWFNKDTNSWEVLRERTDKSHPNAFATANSVCNTIKNPITKEYLFHYISECGYHRNRNNGTTASVQKQQIKPHQKSNDEQQEHPQQQNNVGYQYSS